MDQTGVILVPGGNEKTYGIKRSRQVPFYGKEGKRAFTAVLSVAPTGEIFST